MKPHLVIGLGNPLMGDDGVGCLVASRLADDPRLPKGVQVISAGSDLLRYAQQIEGRARVIVIDAIQDDGEPGNVVSLETIDTELDARQHYAHQLSAVQAIRLLEMTTSTPFLLLGITISAVVQDTCLSPLLAARVPAILERVLQELGPEVPEGAAQQT